MFLILHLSLDWCLIRWSLRSEIIITNKHMFSEVGLQERIILTNITCDSTVNGHDWIWLNIIALSQWLPMVTVCITVTTECWHNGKTKKRKQKTLLKLIWNQRYYSNSSVLIGLKNAVYCRCTRLFLNVLKPI